MSPNPDLLVELLVEELPPKALSKLGAAFAEVLARSLHAQQLVESPVVFTPYASPRRLAVLVAGVRAQAPDQSVSSKLMPASVGLDAQGAPTPALLKKLAALGADASIASQLQQRPDGKATALFWDRTAAGVGLLQGLQTALNEALAQLPIPKVMSYQLADGWRSVNFVRPAHSLVALHGADVVPVQALGLSAGRHTQGHRFEALHESIALRDANSYATQLREEGAVIAHFDERRAEITRQLQAHARELGLSVLDDPALLDEVTGLVERPHVLRCQFDPAFLEVPAECLTLTMKANQKYFPLFDVAGASSQPQGRPKIDLTPLGGLAHSDRMGGSLLSHHFLVVSNIQPKDASQVIQGNERVVRPRLADAKFFFDKDRQTPLANRVVLLDKVVYHGQLGSQGARVQRVCQIAKSIAQAHPKTKLLEADVSRAAQLAKADLLTDMVGEFPELQGTMGRYYALHDGEPAAVAQAIEDHYKPRFAGDELPRGEVGVILALADKLETLAGLFGIGQTPTGDKDPYALRRHALGVIRLLMEKDVVPMGLSDLLQSASAAFGALTQQNPSDLLRTFIFERLAGLLRDQGFSSNELEAVLALQPEHLRDLRPKLEAVRAFAALPEAASLASANKRVGNILKKLEGAAPEGFQTGSEHLPETAERELVHVLAQVQPRADAHFAAGRYTESLRELAALKTPIDAFFDQVMVNAEDPVLRRNRLGLLAALHAVMNRVASLESLAG
jgi:glycyl-tRNA synthetase beta chain